MNIKKDHSMRSTLIRISQLCLIVLFFSCSHEKEKAKTQAKIFSTYLQKEFKIIPGNEKAFYFIVPTSSCAGCKKSVVNYFTKHLKEKNNFLIVTANQTKSLKEFNLQGKNIFIDQDNTIDRLNLDASNTTLIIWDKNKISKIETLTPENIDSLILTESSASVLASATQAMK